MPVWKALPYEAYVRAYSRPSLRQALRLPFDTGQQPASYIFVAGCYNAGTTLIKNLIGASGAVFCPPIEGDVLTSELSDFEGGGWNRCMYGNRGAIDEWRRAGLIDASTLRRDWAPWIRDGMVFLDKSISHSCRLKHLRAAFPGCRFVVVCRNPMDVVAGIKKRSRPTRAAARAVGENRYTDELLLRQYAYLYTTILDDWDVRDTHLVSYESTINEPLETVRELYGFLNLAADEIAQNGNSILIDGSAVKVRPDLDSRKVDVVNRSYLEKMVADVEVSVNVER